VGKPTHTFFSTTHKDSGHGKGLGLRGLRPKVRPKGGFKTKKDLTKRSKGGLGFRGHGVIYLSGKANRRSQESIKETSVAAGTIRRSPQRETNLISTVMKNQG